MSVIKTEIKAIQTKMESKKDKQETEDDVPEYTDEGAARLLQGLWQQEEGQEFVTEGV